MSMIWVSLCLDKEVLLLNILLHKLQVYFIFPMVEILMIQFLMVQSADCRTSLDSVIMCEFPYLIETAANCYCTPKNGSFIPGQAPRCHCHTFETKPIEFEHSVWLPLNNPQKVHPINSLLHETPIDTNKNTKHVMFQWNSCVSTEMKGGPQLLFRLKRDGM